MRLAVVASVLLVLAVVPALAELPDKYIITQPMTWDQARDFCLQEKRELASVHEPNENKAVNQLCGNQKCWIGLVRWNANMGREAWVWSDGNEVQGYTNWKNDKAGASTGYTKGLIDGAGKWEDEGQGEQAHRAICGPLNQEAVAETLADSVGLPGPTGDQGMRGYGGWAGPRGLSGGEGAKGQKGMQGKSGLPGPNGGKGPKGDSGPSGDVGPRGNMGQPGPQGAKGSTGDNGKDGARGETGNSGEMGEKGLVGDDGADGLRGPRGEEGIRGQQGEQGDDGDTGIKGEKGDSGPKGDTGIEGPPAEFPERRELEQKLRVRVDKVMASLKTLEAVLARAEALDRWGEIIQAPSAADLNFAMHAKYAMLGQEAPGSSDEDKTVYNSGIAVNVPTVVGKLKPPSGLKPKKKDCPCYPNTKPQCPCGPEPATWLYVEGGKEPEQLS